MVGQSVTLSLQVDVVRFDGTPECLLEFRRNSYAFGNIETDEVIEGSGNAAGRRHVSVFVGGDPATAIAREGDFIVRYPGNYFGVFDPDLFARLFSTVRYDTDARDHGT